MRILIGCETSGQIRRVMNAIPGVYAYSCDLLPADDGETERHYQGDVLDIIGNAWDLAIFHPSCQFLSNSSASRLYLGAKKENGPDPDRWANMRTAASFFRQLLHADIPKIAIENPIMLGCAVEIIGRAHDQIVQPYQFGDDASKRTCLWLKNLAPLVIPHEEEWIAPRWGCGCGTIYDLARGKTGCPECGGSYPVRRVWGNQTASGQNKIGPSADRWKKRAETYPGIARAIADQWVRPLLCP